MKAIHKKGTKNNYYGYGGEFVGIIDMRLVGKTWERLSKGKWIKWVGNVLVVDSID